MRTTQQFSITLPLDMAEIVEGKIKSGAYASVSEVMRDGVRALLEREAAVERWLREEVVPGDQGIWPIHRRGFRPRPSLTASRPAAPRATRSGPLCASFSPHGPSARLTACTSTLPAKRATAVPMLTSPALSPTAPGLRRFQRGPATRRLIVRLADDRI